MYFAFANKNTSTRRPFDLMVNGKPLAFVRHRGNSISRRMMILNKLKVSMEVRKKKLNIKNAFHNLLAH